MTVDFPAAWCATDLGDLRPCDSTYERYPFDTVPPLDDLPLDGSYRWFGEPGVVEEDRAADLAALADAATAAGVVLPADFVTFQTRALLRTALDDVSVTSCWTDVSRLMPSPFEPGAHLVRFLRDQQDCAFWYLYLRPGRDAFVVHSYHLPHYLDHPFETGEPGPEVPLEELTAEVFWCAPSFEQFAYRFWIENRLWSVLDGGGRELEPAERDYVDRYRRLSVG